MILLLSQPRLSDSVRLVLLCHKFRCLFRAAQHGQRESVVARAATNLRRIVAIEFGTWRSGRNGGSSGLVPSRTATCGPNVVARSPEGGIVSRSEIRNA